LFLIIINNWTIINIFFGLRKIVQFLMENFNIVVFLSQQIAFLLIF